jgi:hypothetical protein
VTKKAYKKALIPGQGRELARGTTLVMDPVEQDSSLWSLNAANGRVAALWISVLLSFIWNFFQPGKFLSYVLLHSDGL